MQKVYVESLGCPKNLVDSELISHHFTKNYSLAPTCQSADIIIINTCGFIEQAKQEAINYILEFAQLKNKRIIVTGCLVNLYKKQLQQHLPEVHEFYSQEEFFKQFLNLEINNSLDYSLSKPLTPKSYTYVKISDGCSRTCSYCTIPLIKGKQYSRPIKNIIKEVEQKVKSGFKELNLIAQDLINFGKENKEDLLALLEKLEKINHNFRIRLLYLYPDKRIIDIVQFMAQSKKLIPYLELPFQHINSKILKQMNRPNQQSMYVDLIKKIRHIKPDIILRSTFIIGFPGESSKEFNELLEFLKEIKFNWAGFYGYSDEEKASSSRLSEKVKPSIIKKRLEKINEAQKAITSEWLNQRVAKVYPVIIDEINEYEQIILGRTEQEAPEIDGNVIIPFQPKIKVGQQVMVKITKSSDFDLYGEINE